jgi:2-polyprenyl-3-methyl-5-hydroxy-6-metoxy-1,4-benzoquinol methylase
MRVLSHAAEVAQGERFEFGANWQQFLLSVDESRIASAERSLQQMLGAERLEGRSFLDIGSGSGLFSVAARRLGADVYSFDYDPQSVASTKELRRRFFPEDPAWQVTLGSVLDLEFLDELGQFDIVYSWGVLHHTGRMWAALSNAAALVNPSGHLFIAIYNDEGAPSRRWMKVKRAYNKGPRSVRALLLCASLVYLYWRPMLKDALQLQPGRTIRAHGQDRGMAFWRDLVDWVGGYPFEVAKPEEIFGFCSEKGFVMTRLRTCGNLGCNEFLFRRNA